MKFPQDVNDRQAFKDFILEFRLTHPILTDMRDGKAFTAGGNIFLFLHGTVAFQVPNDPLSRRLSIALAITQRRGYLLTWFFAAPHDSELLSLTDERVSFDPDLPMKAANSTQPGGGESSRQRECTAGCRLVLGSASSDNSATCASRIDRADLTCSNRSFWR